MSVLSQFIGSSAKQTAKTAFAMKRINDVETVVLAFESCSDISATDSVCSMSFFWVEIATSQFRGHVHLDRYVCVVGWSSIEA